MSARRRTHAQVTRERRRFQTALRLVPRDVASAAEQSVSGIRPRLMRYLDLPPALAVLVIVAIASLVGVIYLGQVNAATNANYTLQALKVEHEQLVRDKQNLQLEIGRAQALPNIETVASDTLKMVPVGDQYIYVEIPSGPLAAMPPLPTPSLPTPTPAEDSP